MLTVMSRKWVILPYYYDSTTGDLITKLSGQVAAVHYDCGVNRQIKAWQALRDAIGPHFYIDYRSNGKTMKIFPTHFQVFTHDAYKQRNILKKRPEKQMSLNDIQKDFSNGR